VRRIKDIVRKIFDYQKELVSSVAENMHKLRRKRKAV
jgi:hypothetical protein